MGKPNLRMLLDDSPEVDLKDAVIHWAEDKGWQVHHCRAAWTAKGFRTPIQGHAGFTDLVLARERDGQLLFWELKSKKGEVEPAQEEWHRILAATGNPVRVLRPSDRDEIERLLL